MEGRAGRGEGSSTTLLKDRTGTNSRVEKVAAAVVGICSKGKGFHTRVGVEVVTDRGKGRGRDLPTRGNFFHVYVVVPL